MSVSGKRIIVTGGGSGIGRALVLGFARARSSVVIGDLRFDAATRVASEVARFGGRAVAVKVDVRRYQDDVAMVKRCLEDFGGVDVLINNAGIRVEVHADNLFEENRVIPQKSVMDTRLEDWNVVLDTNLTGAFLCSKAALPALVKEGGSIINISSSFGRKGGAGRSMYCASKHGVEGFTKALALEVKDANIGVNCLYPDGRLDVDGRGGGDPEIVFPPAEFLAQKQGKITGLSICVNRWKEELKDYL